MTKKDINWINVELEKLAYLFDFHFEYFKEENYFKLERNGQIEKITAEGNNTQCFLIAVHKFIEKVW